MAPLPSPVTVSDEFLRLLLREAQETNALLRELIAQRERDRQAILDGTVELQAAVLPAAAAAAGRPGGADTPPAKPPASKGPSFGRRR